MPKNPFKATRRKSSGNVLDYQVESPEPAQSSFRVLERPKENSDGIRGTTAGRASGRPFTSHLIPLRGKSADDLGVKGDRWVTDHESNGNADACPKKQSLITDRGSGGSGSSAHYDSSTGSARYSSTSTLPSSVDQEPGAEEDLYPVSRPQKSATIHMPHNAPIDDDLPPVPSFASRTGRALSFGFKNRLNSSQSNKSFGLMPPGGQARAEHRQSPPHRDRAETSSSYASTAVPPRLDANTSLGSSSLDFGEDFGDMFVSRRSTPDINLPPVPPPHTFHRTESEPLYPPRTHSRQAFAHSPTLESTRLNAGSPYLDDDLTQEREGFLSSSNLSSPTVPPPSAHLGYFNKAAGYAPLNDTQNSPTLERMSSDSYASSIDETSREHEAVKTIPHNKASHIDSDEDRYLKRHQLTDGPVPRYSTSPSKTTNQPPHSSSTSTLRTVPFSGFQVNRADTTSPGISDGGSLFTDSTDATPRARKLHPPSNEDDTFLDVSPAGPASRAIRPDTARSKTDSVTVTGTPKKMTKAEFEALQHQSAENSEEEQESDNEDEDEDDIDRAKQLTSQRRKQEANMSVYRQQMKKTAGGGPTDLPINGRPELNRSSNSAPAAGFTGLHLGGLDAKPPGEVLRGKHDSDEDDDVPLGILQAHGFPGVNRPPTSGDAAGMGRASVAGSIVNGGAGQGNLPPFARRLPPDPYFGASIVNHSNREALAFNDNASVYGVPPSVAPQMSAQLAPPQMGHPGGLVGVIAGEERARAARRGSPNAQGGYNSTPMPLPSNMPGQMGRTMSMGNIPTPSVYTPTGVPPMPMMPMMNPMMTGMPGQGAADQTQQQMQQFMQMQMQFMQNMLSMQQGQMGAQPQQDFLGVPGQPQTRPMSMASQNSPQQNQIPNSGRSMTMLNPPPSWGSMQPPARPHSGMPQVGAYAPSVNGFNMNGGGGPGPGYAPSIAPSERSNIGMPSRYRPVSNMGDTQSGRAQSLTSSVTLQALKSEMNQSTPNFMHPDPQQQQSHHQPAAAKSTIRIVDKPKGSPRVSTTQLEKAEDEEEGWAAMKKKREERKFRLGRRKDKGDSNEPSLNELYKNFD